MMIGEEEDSEEFVLEMEPEVAESTLASARIGRISMGRSGAELVLVLKHFRISIKLIGIVDDRCR